MSLPDPAESDAAEAASDIEPVLAVGAQVLTPDGPGIVEIVHIVGHHAVALIRGEQHTRPWPIAELTYRDHTAIPLESPIVARARAEARRVELDQARSAEGLDLGNGYRLELDLDAGYGWISDATGTAIAFVRARFADNRNRHWWLQNLAGGPPNRWTYQERHTDRSHAAVRAARKIGWHLYQVRREKLAVVLPHQARRLITLTLARVRELRELTLPVSQFTGLPVEVPPWYHRYRRYVLSAEQSTALAVAAEHALAAESTATAVQRRRRRVLHAAAVQLRRHAYEVARDLATIPSPGMPDPYADPYTPTDRIAGTSGDPVQLDGAL
ncbi:hypothetical protein AB0C65_35995 [Nocardia sp. NPDC048505]|uniref:hypothetical protein n=1 Tax=Nocardia sp. NPDC048505 TaxID=3155756 RepID=UPI0033C4FA88